MRSLEILAAVAVTCNALDAQGKRAGFVDESQSSIRDVGGLPRHTPLWNPRVHKNFDDGEKKAPLPVPTFYSVPPVVPLTGSLAIVSPPGTGSNVILQSGNRFFGRSDTETAEGIQLVSAREDNMPGRGEIDKITRQIGQRLAEILMEIAKADQEALGRFLELIDSAGDKKPVHEEVLARRNDVEYWIRSVNKNVKEQVLDLVLRNLSLINQDHLLLRGLTSSSPVARKSVEDSLKRFGRISHLIRSRIEELIKLRSETAQLKDDLDNNLFRGREVRAKQKELDLKLSRRKRMEDWLNGMGLDDEAKVNPYELRKARERLMRLLKKLDRGNGKNGFEVGRFLEGLGIVEYGDYTNVSAATARNMLRKVLGREIIRLERDLQNLPIGRNGGRGQRFKRKGLISDDNTEAGSITDFSQEDKGNPEYRYEIEDLMNRTTASARVSRPSEQTDADGELIGVLKRLRIEEGRYSGRAKIAERKVWIASEAGKLAEIFGIHLIEETPWGDPIDWWKKHKERLSKIKERIVQILGPARAQKVIPKFLLNAVQSRF